MKGFLVVLALAAAACGGTSSVANDPPVDESTIATSIDIGQDSTATATISADPDEATPATATSDPTREKPDGPPAPDFVLELGEGGEFRPSSESRPIYMVFWAEW